MITLTDHQGGEPVLRLGAVSDVRLDPVARQMAPHLSGYGVYTPIRVSTGTRPRAAPFVIGIGYGGMDYNAEVHGYIDGEGRVVITDAQVVEYVSAPTHDAEDDCA